MGQAFVPGLELARMYYGEIVRPLLAEALPGLRYSAGLIGWGSDVLGLDSPRSTDHNWGPRLQVFVGPANAGRAGEITALLAARLPERFRGWPTTFADVTDSGPPRHWVEVAELGRWLDGQLGFDPRAGVTLLDWLAAPCQRLAELTAGAVFHDGLGEGGGADEAGGPGGSGPGGGAGLGAARRRLAWYPDDVWRYLLACQWARIGDEEAFPGRCAEVGDDLGCAVVTARLARDLMRLCLLMARRYPPYSKWLGSAFAALPQSAVIGPALAGAMAEASWPEREVRLCAAYEAVAAWHNELGLTVPLAPVAGGSFVGYYFGRPFRVAGAGRFCDALRAAITEPAVAQLPGTGAVDQFIDSTGALGQVAWLRAVMAGRLAAG